jgi:hypothetical protein
LLLILVEFDLFSYLWIAEFPSINIDTHENLIQMIVLIDKKNLASTVITNTNAEKLIR